MPKKQPPLPAKSQITRGTRETVLEAGASVWATRDHDIIRGWASEVDAEPATGEATTSGPASALKVTDGGTGLRFNFPGVSPFRAISWDEWLDHFRSHDLAFVYDDTEPGRPKSARYRIVPASELSTSSVITPDAMRRR
jgi:hypothetical protein